MTAHDNNEPEHHTRWPAEHTRTGDHRMSITPSSDFPDADERARLNTAFAATAAETGFWDERGDPAPWPDDIEDWTPETHQPDPHRPYDF